eukprot:gnl/TRDRNA2_/TRDRNA2_125732_c0_seq1.p1 gnl/TRDRNA2_/TRDRNA2_125732_c0~~gnl/TRDRNA2_/TRDRNA2_125732_c0_seq1.p1  ORF type:complete len:474 (-),score=42.41 gnl/TRDRNA2_/TRDRNA2_125732_c0_seq1:169-1590(-)
MSMSVQPRPGGARARSVSPRAMRDPSMVASHGTFMTSSQAAYAEPLFASSSREQAGMQVSPSYYPQASVVPASSFMHDGYMPAPAGSYMSSSPMYSSPHDVYQRPTGAPGGGVVGQPDSFGSFIGPQPVMRPDGFGGYMPVADVPQDQLIGPPRSHTPPRTNSFQNPVPLHPASFRSHTPPPSSSLRSRTPPPSWGEPMPPSFYGMRSRTPPPGGPHAPPIDGPPVDPWAFGQPPTQPVLQHPQDHLMASGRRTPPMMPPPHHMGQSFRQQQHQAELQRQLDLVQQEEKMMQQQEAMQGLQPGGRVMQLDEAGCAFAPPSTRDAWRRQARDMTPRRRRTFWEQCKDALGLGDYESDQYEHGFHDGPWGGGRPMGPGQMPHHWGGGPHPGSFHGPMHSGRDHGPMGRFMEDMRAPRGPPTPPRSRGYGQDPPAFGSGLPGDFGTNPALPPGCREEMMQRRDLPPRSPRSDYRQV